MIVKCIWYVTILFANRWLCTCTLRINITVPPVDRYRGKKAETWGPSWQHGGPLNRVDVLEAGRANARRLLRRPPLPFPTPPSCSQRMVKKLEPGLTGEVTIQPSRAPRLDFNWVVYLTLADNVSRPLPSPLRGVNQRVMNACIGFSASRGVLLACLSTHT